MTTSRRASRQGAPVVCTPRLEGRGARGAYWNSLSSVGVPVKASDRQLLFELRKALLHLHKTLLDWERAAYERVNGRASAAELLKVIVEDPQFAWLRPISELIVRIDSTVDTEEPDAIIDVDALLARAREVVSPGESGTAQAQRYLAALQEHPDAVFAHRAVTSLLKTHPPRETAH
jgi:hypothetical protein